MSLTLKGMLVLAALHVGTPHELDAPPDIDGMTCNSGANLEFVVGLYLDGGDPGRTIEEVNKMLGFTACFFAGRFSEKKLRIIGQVKPFAAPNGYAIFNALLYEAGADGDLVQIKKPIEWFTIKRTRTMGAGE